MLLKHVLDQIPVVKLPHWAQKKGLHLTLRDGVLRRTNEQGNIRLVHVPIVFWTVVIQGAHYVSYSAQFGRRKTIGALWTQFIWGTQSQDVKKVLQTCIQCWNQTRVHLHSQLLQRKLPTEWPRDIMAMDFFSPLPTAQLGARYILLCMGHFTKWIKLTSFLKIKEEETVEFLRDRWVTQNGSFTQDRIWHCKSIYCEGGM